MKKLFVLIFLVFTGCGDDSSSDRTTTRTRRTLRDSRINSCVDTRTGCSLTHRKNNIFAGNSTETPFSIGQTVGFSDNIRLGLEFYAANQNGVEARGQMEVLSTSQFGVDYCRLPNGLYDLTTIRAGVVGAAGRVNANHEYSNIELEGRGPVSFHAHLHHSLSLNLGDDWALSAKLEIVSINGRACNLYGRILYSFSFQTQ